MHFRVEFAKHLIKHIESANVVLGAVAWLTSYAVLDALAKDNKNVVFIIQKEDFLRPDIGADKGFKETLKRKYDKLNSGLIRYDFGETILSQMSYCGDPTMDAVRCIGNMNNAKNPAFPRMHNKFIVFANTKAECDDPEHSDVQTSSTIVPYAVWTGSFNITKNAGMSLENAIYITDPIIVNAYYQEFAQIAALSESLNWFHDWVEPEWRIGT